MSLISMEFLTFVAVAVIGYYLIPKRYQWVCYWLSYIYYASSGMSTCVFVVYNSCNLWDSKNDLWSRSKVCQAERKDKNLQEKYYGVSIASGFWNAGSVEIHEFYNLEYQHIISYRY